MEKYERTNRNKWAAGCCLLKAAQALRTTAQKNLWICRGIFFFLPAAISPTTSLQSWPAIVINWKSELVCSLKPLSGETTLQLRVRNPHPPSRRSKPCRSSCQHTPPPQKARPGQTSAGYQAAYCRLFLWRWVFTFTTVITGMIGTITLFFVLYASLQALLA